MENRNMLIWQLQKNRRKKSGQNLYFLIQQKIFIMSTKPVYILESYQNTHIQLSIRVQKTTKFQKEA